MTDIILSQPRGTKPYRTQRYSHAKSTYLMLCIVRLPLFVL